MTNWSDEETDEPLIADHRNFYKVKKWSRDGQRVVELLFAGSSLDKAKRVFDRWAKHRPRIRGPTAIARSCRRSRYSVRHASANCEECHAKARGWLLLR